MEYGVGLCSIFKYMPVAFTLFQNVDIYFDFQVTVHRDKFL